MLWCGGEPQQGSRSLPGLQGEQKPRDGQQKRMQGGGASGGAWRQVGAQLRQWSVEQCSGPGRGAGEAAA